MAWNNNNSEILYRKYNLNNYSLSVIQEENISVYSGFNYNSNPSMIAASDGSARLTWLGRRSIWLDNRLSYEQKCAFADPNDNTRIWSFGYGVQSNTIALSNSCYVIGWGCSDSDPLQVTDSRSLQDIISLDINGKYLQIINSVRKLTTFPPEN